MPTKQISCDRLIKLFGGPRTNGGSPSLLVVRACQPNQPFETKDESLVSPIYDRGASKQMPPRAGRHTQGPRQAAAYRSAWANPNRVLIHKGAPRPALQISKPNTPNSPKTGHAKPLTAARNSNAPKTGICRPLNTNLRPPSAANGCVYARCQLLILRTMPSALLITSVSVSIRPLWRTTPSTRPPLVTPVAQKTVSPEASSFRLYLRS